MGEVLNKTKLSTQHLIRIYTASQTNAALIRDEHLDDNCRRLSCRYSESGSLFSVNLRDDVQVAIVIQKEAQPRFSFRMNKKKYAVYR